MKHEEAIVLVKKKLPEHRFTHTLGVYESALDLAKHYGENCEQAGLAAILHDYAKNTDKDTLSLWIKASDYPNKILNWNPVVWHGFAAAYILKEKFHVTDPDVLAAIAYHTTGHKKMNRLAKIVYLADMIEKGRDFPGIDKLRKLAFVDLDQAMLEGTRNTIRHLLDAGATIAPYTIGIYNVLLKTKKDE